MARLEYPMAAVAGADEVKCALLLLAVDPALKGLLIAGPPGSGKSVLARSFRALGADPFIEVPANVTEDRLLGGIDIAATIRSGRRRVQPGLLARAHGGVICIDHVNLLPAAIAAHVAGALGSGVVKLEREGISAETPASFALIGTYDPAEGAPARPLRDGIAFQLAVDTGSPVGERVEIAARALAFGADPAGFVSAHAGETAAAADLVRRARSLWPEVRATGEAVRHLCELALRLGVEGHRAEIFAIRAARAHAALCGRLSVEQEDLELAARLVFHTRVAPAGGSSPAASPKQQSRAGGTSAEDRPAPVIDNPAPAIVARREHAGAQRGRYVRAVQTDPGHGAIAIDATIRAAAPFQRRGAARLRIRAADLRFKELRQKTGIEIIFALDASGSMASNRIQHAKGAIVRLLRDAYVHRDTVALIGFRGARAELLLRPGRSVELARRALDDLPTGGGTPLAGALLLALEVWRRADRPVLFVLLTDGRANVSSTGEPVWTELERAAAALRAAAVPSVVIDTSRSPLAGADTGRLAHLLGARHVQLPRMDATAVYRSVAGIAAEVR